MTAIGHGFVADPAWKAGASKAEAERIDATIEHGSFRLAAKALGIDESMVRRSVNAARSRFGTPAPSRVTRWLLTAAQDDTPVHAAFWANLLAYGEDLGAPVLVGGFTYQKGLFEDHATRTAIFATDVQPYIAHENMDLGPLLFAAKMNILPTATRPLTGLETYSRGRWAVFPHAKIQLSSVPALTGTHAALQMTTGACTVPNYIEKKAGMKAEFHHVIGATIVELDGAGRLFCRQISATDDGGFQDLDARVAGGKVTRGHRIESITWGDIHHEKIDPSVAMCAWGLDVETGLILSKSSMLSDLRPRSQFFHDLLDFMARNHHRKNDPHFKALMIAQRTDKVEAAISACARFIRATEVEWCTSVVVPSNHNDAFPRWLRETSPSDDPLNARFWCEASAAIYGAIEDGEPEFDVFRWALTRADARRMQDIVFPTRNSSYVICQDQGGIECALHGDIGPNGSRGSSLGFTKAAMRMNKAHDHTASIFDGVYSAGLCGLMDQGYNSGLSSWSHTQIVTYPNSKRTLVTMRDGRYRAS